MPALHLATFSSDATPPLGHPLCGGWIEPVRGARYLAVEGPGDAEVYETAGRLPVRVTTGDVDIESSSATFRVRQYAADGSEIANDTLRAVVAG